MDGHRQVSAERTVEASPAAVWHALLDPGELVAWYAEAAEVDPREGGRHWARWGEGVEGASRIELLDPPRRLRLAHQGGHAATREAALAEPITETYVLEPAGQGRTTVRVVQGGIPAGESWDGYTDGERYGWHRALAALAHHVEGRPGPARASVRARAPLACEPGEVWDRVTGGPGLGLAGVGAGNGFETETAHGWRLRGLLWSWQPPRTFLARVDEPDDAYLSGAVDTERGEVRLGWSCYRWSPAALERLRDGWVAWFEALVAGST